VIRSAAFLLLFTILSGCLAASGSSSGFNIIPVSQEVEMGRQLSQQVEERFPLYRSREAQLYVSYLGNRLVRSYGGPTLFDFTFKIIDDEEVNAFNIPGGYVYVHRGLIAEADNEAELASVLSHEIGHALARHSTQMASTQLGASFILSMLLGPRTSQWENMVAGLFTNAGILAYTRSMEREADRLGIRILYKAGYDPQASVSFMNKLLSLKKREPDALEKLFSSHPTTSERIHNAELEISRLPPRRGLYLNTTRFIQIRRTVKTDPYPPRRGRRVR
jgi:predicted Zn-dependent protease